MFVQSALKICENLQLITPSAPLQLEVSSTVHFKPPLQQNMMSFSCSFPIQNRKLSITSL